MQFVDINTCEPVPQLLIDIWAVSISPQTKKILLEPIVNIMKVQCHWCLQRC
jgi:hypothetical protein